MRTTDWPDLLRRPEKPAGRAYLSGLNRSHLPWLLIGMAAAAFVVATVQVVERRWLVAVPWAVLLLASLGHFFLRDREWLKRSSGDYLLGNVILLLVATTASVGYPIGLALFAGFGYSAFLVFVRWAGSRLLILAAALLTMVGWAALTPSREEEAIVMFVLSPIAIVVLAAVGWRVSRGRLRGFSAEYRRQAGVERDRARMSEELSDARAVQLSMLPRQPPRLPWVDVAAACLPATEVGGDYYDLLVLDEDRLAVVIGDVAGHGMASGLVLAGVRSGLYLLRDRLDRGAEVLGQLDRMLRDTSPGRMFVTLQIALLDRRRRTVTVTNAGHPPLVLIRSGESSPVGAAGTPLGTRLEGGFADEIRRLAAGDTLVLFSDGLIELRNREGEDFDGRLEETLLAAAELPSAEEARDEILARVRRFQGDVEREDDLTLVVARLGGQ